VETILIGAGLHKTNSMMKISSFFAQTENINSTSIWHLVSHDPNLLPADELAICLADRIMEYRCRGRPEYHTAWKASREKRATLLVSARKILREAFVKPVFGLPECAEHVPVDHREGYVGEMLWYFIHQETSTEVIEHIEPPGFKPTDPGSDGLVIHRTEDGDLMFRLWEMKKCTGVSPVSATVSTAYDQLDSRAIEYLARHTAFGQETSNVELALFFGKLIELWVVADKAASAGVSVTTSVEKAPSRCFTTFGSRFPGFIGPPTRLRGMLTAIEDFSDFTEKVRAAIWTGL
jgi:hypothetical protein